LEIGHRYSIY